MNTNYKPTLIITPLLEAKIKYLSYKYPNNEWSGILYVKYEGTLKEKNFTVTAVDMYLKDVGNSTLTEFKVGHDHFNYAMNNGLEECDFGLIHSHHNMKAFFSATDSNELRTTGMQKDLYVSLIVNNDGNYCAKVSQRIQKKGTVNLTITAKDNDEQYSVETTEEVDMSDIMTYDFDIKGTIVNYVINEQIRRASNSGGVTTYPTVKKRSSTFSYVPKPSKAPISNSLPYSEEDDVYPDLDTVDAETFYEEKEKVLDEISDAIILNLLSSKEKTLKVALYKLPQYLKSSSNLNIEVYRTRLNTLIEREVTDYEEYDIDTTEIEVAIYNKLIEIKKSNNYNIINLLISILDGNI